ncbi:MAG: hypothetical protein ACLPN1_15970 [Dissulfurispiraceae bacterium]|jgi:hypothetical protein
MRKREHRDYLNDIVECIDDVKTIWYEDKTNYTCPVSDCIELSSGCFTSGEVSMA